MKTSHIIRTGILLLTTFGYTFAQKEDSKLKQEVEVVKAYQPTISDAYKINDIPQIKEEKQEKPVFEYSIYSEPLFSTFTVKPVQAAKITETAKTDMGKGLLKLGIGNYTTPYGELFYNAIPGKKSNFGMHFKHLSSHGDIKLLNGDKVDAPFSDNSAELFSKHFFSNSTLTLTGFFDRKAFQYYGYTGDSLSNAVKESIIPLWQDKQAFAKGGANVSLKSNYRSGSKMMYDLGLYYHYFGSKTGQSEHYGKLKVNLDKDFSNFRGVLESSLSFYRADSITNRLNTSRQRQQILLMVNPAVVFSGEKGFVQLGVKTYTLIDDDVDAKITLTPNVKAEWSPVKNILTLYAHASGYLDQNTYSKIAAENPYANPMHDIRDTQYQYILSGGIKGKFSSKTNYLVGASYSGIKDKPFYYISSTDYKRVLSPLRKLNNTFDVLYDDLNLLKFSGELFHAASENLSFRLSGNYYSYDMETLASPWNMPEFDVNISMIYKTKGPLSFSLDAYVIGKRQALHEDIDMISSLYVPPTPLNMDTVFDLNASVEYQFSESLSFFAQLNNFAFQKYETWLGYTNQGFNALAGISFRF